MGVELNAKLSLKLYYTLAPTEQMLNHFIEDLERLVRIESSIHQVVLFDFVFLCCVRSTRHSTVV